MSTKPTSKEFKIYKLLQHIILSSLLIILAITSYKTYNVAKEYEHKMTEIAKLQNVTDLAKENIMNKFSFDWFRDRKEIKPSDTVLINNKQGVEQEKKYAIYVAAIVILILSSYFIVSLKTFNVYSSLMTSIVLVFGLITPIMMVSIHKEILYIGDVVLAFESKSMITSIAKLFDTGDYIVGSIIVLFSVIIPLAKVISLILISIFEDTLFTHKLIGFFKIIGKWSMIDVFVIALLLVFLSTKQEDVSRTEAEMGIYIFLLYVMASMFVSITVSKMIKEIKYKKELAKNESI